MSLLKGVVVLDLGSFISGPYVGQLLAELGAEVIKVENPSGGDPFRSFTDDGFSSQFCAYNRQKKSLTLDLTKPGGREAFLRMAKTADVVSENFRPGVARKLGVDSEDLLKINPRLIYCALSGFGPDGPHARRPAYDTVAMGMSGLLSQLVEPSRQITGPAMADAISGLYAANAILAALYRREQTGQGARIDVAMLEALIAFSTDPFAHFFKAGTSPTPTTRAAASQSYALTCADGKRIGLHLSSPAKFWEGLVTSIERPDLLTDPRFAGRGSRVANFEALGAELQKAFLAKPRAEWETILTANDVPFAPVYAIEEVQDDPQVKHLSTFVDMEHPTMGRMRGINPPVHVDRKRPLHPHAPPTLGEHTDEVLRRFSFSEAEIAELRGGGVV